MPTDRLLHAVGVSGSPGSASQSRALLGIALSELRARGATTDLIDLRLLDAGGLLGRAADRDVQTALELFAGADILAVSSPVYRATFSGLLKVFLDQLPPDALAGTVAIPIMTGGGPHHLLAIEHGLNPALASVGATLVPTATYGTSTQFVDGRPNGALTERVRRAVTEAVALAEGLRTARPVSPSSLPQSGVPAHVRFA